MMHILKASAWALIIGTHLAIAALFLRNFIRPPPPYARRISSALLGGMALSVAGLVARLVGWIPHVLSLPFMALAATVGVFGCVVLFHTGGRR